LERVVDWVVDGSVTGEAKPRLTVFKAVRVRRAWLRLRARRREAIVKRLKVYVEEREGWSKGATAVETVSLGDERLRFGSQIVHQHASQSHDPLFQTTVFDPDCSLTLTFGLLDD
jgi:hypothetical protein